MKQLLIASIFIITLTACTNSNVPLADPNHPMENIKKQKDVEQDSTPCHKVDEIPCDDSQFRTTKIDKGEVIDPSIPPKVIPEHISPDWRDYKKPEGWQTVVNKEYGFAVDIPQEWNFSSETTGASYTEEGTHVFAPPWALVSVAFLLPQGLIEVKGNDDLIEKGGEAFRYFDHAFIDGGKGNDILRMVENGQGTIKYTDFKPNLIDVNVEQDAPHFQTNLSIVNTIIKSFRVL